MKRFYIIIPPAVFVLSAAIAWSTGSPAERVSGSANTIARSPRQRAAAGAGSGDVFTTLARMEGRILPHNPAPPAKCHDAKGMEAALYSDKLEQKYSGRKGGVSQALAYSMEWANDAPEEMFAWLNQQHGNRSYYAYVLFERWAKKDLEAALAAALKLEDRKLRAQALWSSLEVLNNSNPSRAREVLLQNLSLFPPGGGSPICSGKEASIWNLLLTLPPGDERSHLQVGLLDRMESTRLISIWKQASETERREWCAAGFAPIRIDADSFEGLGDLMREKADTSGDPAVAEKFIEIHGDTWAKRDPAGALGWAQTHLKGKARAERCERFLEIGASSDLDSTLRVWQNLPDGYMKQKAAEVIRREAPESRKAEVEEVLKSP